MDKELIEKLIAKFKSHEILYKGFKDYLSELKTELSKDDFFKNKNPKLLEELIKIEKIEGKILIFNIKILNNEFQFDEVKATIDHVKNINNIMEDNAKTIAEDFIKANLKL